MRLSRFLMCLAAIVFAGIALRYYESPLPELSVEEFLREGRVRETNAQYPQAIRYYSAALQKDPRNWEALTHRGMCRVATKEILQSMADLEDAIRFSHGKARDAYIQRSFLNRMGGEFEKALADANKAIELAPKDAIGYGIRAMAYEDPKKGDPVKAKADYDRFLSLLTPAQRERLLPADGKVAKSAGTF